MIKVLLAEDQRLFREGVRSLLKTEDDIEVVGMAKDGTDALAKLAELSPDVVLMDIHMPNLDGIQATSRIKANHPAVKVVLLTTTPDEDLIIRGISVGADGFLLKELYPENLHRAIRDAYRGQTVFNGEVASILARRIRKLTLSKKQILGKRLENHGLFFTDRELDIAYLMMEKHSNRQIASKLFLGEGTVKNYISIIYDKLHIHKRNEATEYLHTILRK